MEVRNRTNLPLHNLVSFDGICVPGALTEQPLANGRPIPPSGTAHHSRLITAKLTNAVPSSTASPGWSASRPGSSSSTANPSPAQTPGITQTTRRDSATIQNGTAQTDRNRGNASKPWGDLKKPQSGAAAGPSTDFPTAAEVAHTRAQCKNGMKFLL